MKYRIVPLAQLRVNCSVSCNGSNAINVLEAAKRYGLESDSFSKFAGYYAKVIQDINDLYLNGM